MSADHKLLDAYDKISSSKITERTSGLNDLKHLLIQRRSDGGLKDKGFHKMYETIFKATRVEQDIYNKQSKSTMRKASGSRLQTCGSVLRAGVELGAKSLRLKTVRAVQNHIMSVLPAGKPMCEPLSMDYVRALRALFQHAPHIEHLKPEDWEPLAMFCCTHVRTQLGLADEDEREEEGHDVEMLEVGGRNLPGRGAVLVREGSIAPRRSAGGGSGSQHQAPMVRLSHESEELLMCLRNLLAAPNAPIITNAQIICDTLLGFLRSQSTYTRAHQHVFSSLNFVLNVVTTNDLAIISKACEEIIPIISRLWSTKTPGLKDEMIISLIRCQPHIRARIRSANGHVLRARVEDLFENLCAEYISRSDREILQLDDVTFPSPVGKLDANSPLSLRVISLRTNVQNLRVEQTWMVPSLIARVVEMLDFSSDISRRTRMSEDVEGTRKRQRMYDRFGEMRRFARSTSTSQKLLALQVISFLADIQGINESEFLPLMQDLHEACSDDNPAITVWALVAIGSCAFLKCGSDPLYSKVWHQVWKLCARYATNQSTCRVACHVMRILLSRDLVPYSSISKDVDSMLRSIDINGPASLCDSSLALWCLILDKRNTMVHSTRFNPGERLFQWFSSKWRPAQEGLDKSTATSYSHHTAAVDIINFLSACCGIDPLQIEPHSQQICGPIAQASIRTARCRGLIRVLLNEDHDVDDDVQADTPSPHTKGANIPDMGLQIQLAEFIERHVVLMHEKWTSIAGQKQGISGVLMQNFVGFILIATVLCSNFSGSSQERAKTLDIKLRDTMLGDLIRYLRSDECSQKQIDGLLFAIHGFLPKASEMLSSTSKFADNFFGTTALLVTQISMALGEKDKAAVSFSESASQGTMDTDDDGFSDNVRNSEKQGGGFQREELEASCSEEAFRASTSALLELCTLSIGDASHQDICGQFVQYLQRTSTKRLIMMRPVIKDFLLAASDKLLDEDATKICDHFSKELLGDYSTERCETSVALCVDAITALANKWASNNLGSQKATLAEVCEQVYDHVIWIGLENQLTSYTIRNLLAKLLERILHANSDKSHRQATLKLLISLLKDEDIRVIYYVSQRLHTLFQIFGESAHLKLTIAIEAVLPSVKTWTEGLAMRVHTLGYVAIASLSNISRLVYRIFETGQLQDAAQYATRALLTVAKASGLQSQRDLFKLFSAKLIFAWSDSYALEDFPSLVFGYGSMAELCKDIPGELIAQLLANSRDDDAEIVASQNGETLNELLVKSFAKVVAYSLAWSVNYRPPQEREGEPPKPTLIVRIRKRIGDDKYSELFAKHFPLIISNLYELMQEDGASEKLLSKDPNLVDVHHVMKEITTEGYSDRELAQPLKPHFKVGVILNAIDYACKVIELDDKGGLWTPSMVTFVARKLFDTLHPARGPVHTCGVIRNIRLLICLAGSRVHEGYQLQMLIHGLKPYVVDTACAEDTVGILRYLLIKGYDYLSKHPSFVIGTSLSIFTSLREYSRANLNHGPQETQIRSTLSVVQSLHSWLASYLAKLVFPTLSAKKNEGFQSIIASAVGFRHDGNTLKDTKEGEFLRHLLDDDRTKDKLLDDVSRQLAFSLFCSNFTRPASFREDIFGKDCDSFERSKSLLRICRRSDVNDGFLLWSARVLGRAYASTGQLHTDWMQEMEFDHPIDFPSKGSQIDVGPKVGILRRLKALLFSDNKAVVALAEAALTQIVHDEAARGETTFTYIMAEDEYNALGCVEAPVTEVTAPQAIAPFGDIQAPVSVWIKDVTVAMCTNMPEAPVIKGLSRILQEVHGLAEELFPYITHILLAREFQTSKGIRDGLSKLFQLAFQNHDEKTVPHSTILIKTVLYLRSQPRDKEVSKASRDEWLDIDFLEAAKAACVCKMFKTALLFTEIHSYEKPTTEIPSDLLLEIFQNIDDPDSFYGVSQTFSLQTVMNNFEYEGDGWKSLSLRAANLESGIRLGVPSEDESLGIIDSLNTLGMNGLSHSFLQSGTFVSDSSGRTVDNMYRSAWKLEQWDLPCPDSCNTRSALIYRALQSINNTVDSRPISLHMDPHFLGIMKQITAGTQTGHTLGGGMRALAMLAETEEVFVSTSSKQLAEAWDRLQSRNSWMETGKYADVEEMMAMRQATFGSLAKRQHLRINAGINEKEARYMEATALVGCCKMARKHKVLQHALSAATQLNKVVQPCRNVGLDISGVATLQAANVLWEDGQSVPSIKMLLALENDPTSPSQNMVVGRAKLLAKLGSRISEARLEKPDKIMSRYLERAIGELNHNETGSEAGRVFHEFATFCDQQLHNPNNIQDYERALKLKRDKEAEVNELAKLMKQSPSSAEVKNNLARENVKAKSWLALDDAEYARLKNNRDAFLEKSISNYLKCLAACDDYDGDAVRFSSLWLANSEEGRVNRAAADLDKVPSRKLVPLMNQLSSRLLNDQNQHSPRWPHEGNEFQRLLMGLTIKICQEHPFHGIYQILALSKTRTKDEVSTSRQQAAMQVIAHLKSSRGSQEIITSLENATRAYEKLAHAKVDKKKDGRTTLETLLKDTRDRARKFERDIPSYGIPPPTMHIDIRADCDYSKLPRVTRYDPAVSLALGLSTPKVIKCEASDGTIFKQLVKGGQDDLRQDAIMEQVFEQVSVLLQKGQITRQRNLKIRTYKVIPLSATSGIIEFVPNTIPLHEYLIPAHAKYFPGDWNQSKCRRIVGDAQSKPRDVRVKEFQRVMENFHPSMHFFFMHEFNGPDEWYASRLAYTRSTAAISILGYVLGLGDRHGHNILLDTKTGEVVHIDLGVAFEQGRILPVPEVVPFRLTRDIVDGMGVTKTEGVFRRCCEFTLEVLRNESYSITTILDVLRYDPLYSWSMSPLRMKRMQDNHLEQTVASAHAVDGLAKPKNAESESEAHRAITVVSKKLSKTLSVSATVNELIQQAGDERNLAVLYSGWAAYA